MRTPECICYDHIGFVYYVSDSESNLIFKFDENFRLIQKFGSKANLRSPKGNIHLTHSSTGKIFNFLRFLLFEGLDFDTDTMKLYVCDYMNQRCCTFNEQCQYFDEFQLSKATVINYNEISNGENILNKFYPYRIKLSKNHVFVSDDWMGGNCIRVFDKLTYNLIQNIKDLPCYNPYGLLYDNNTSYLYSIGNLYYDNGSAHLFCFDCNPDQNFKLISKIDLDVNCSFFNFCLDTYNLRLYCIAESQLFIFYF